MRCRLRFAEHSRNQTRESTRCAGLSVSWSIGLWAAVILILVTFPYRRAEAHFAHARRLYEMDQQGHVLAHVVKRIEGTSDTWQLLRRDLLANRITTGC